MKAKTTFNEAAWFRQTKRIILLHLTDSRLSVFFLAHQTGTGRRTLERRIKRLTGLTVLQYITEHQLLKAKQLIENKEVTSVAKAAKAAGFTKPGYFAALFKRRFGVLPLVLIKTVAKQ